ncbi:oxygen-regulated protein 1 [Pelodytes ibericus]
MSDTASTNISVAQASSADSGQTGSVQQSYLAKPSSAKKLCFYKSGDPQFNGIKMVVTNRSFKTFDALLDSLSKKVPLPFGVRNITTPRGIHHVTTLEDLEDGKSYICSHQKKIKPINLDRASKKPLLWQSSRPISAGRRAAQLARHNEVVPFQRENTIVIGNSKKLVIYKNGDTEFKHNIVFNKKSMQSFEALLEEITEALQFPVFKLYNTDGRRILSIHALLLSSGTIVAAGREPFKHANYEAKREFLPAKLPGISNRVFPQSRSKQAMKSPGQWKVSIITSEIPSAGTTSQVYITFYGHLRASEPVFLYSNEEEAFQNGQENNFEINIGDIGELYKIRIGHTNSGDSPAWHCEEVQLLNIYSNEQFSIKVNRWLAHDEDDGEICREFPVYQHGPTSLPVTIYEIRVVTGDLWNAGTEAKVYISIHGENGDTGSRQLVRSIKPNTFVKGQTDNFKLEAVHLGDLNTVIIGHDGLEPGNGWYLEKIIIHDPVKYKEYIFFCHRWLDEGEDDGRIVRQLFYADEADFPAQQELELKKKQIWSAEKWKYQKGNILQFYCKATKKFIRLTPDGKVDALGEKKEKYGFFDVMVKRGNVRVFNSHQIRNLALAIDKGIVTAMDNSGILCELLVHLHLNRCATLESTRVPGLTISFDSEGRAADDETHGYAEISKEFVVHVKGIFHNGTIVLLTTSLSQALCVRQDGFCTGTGNQNEESYWRVHKISSAVCMFESVTIPRMYIQIKNGQCDGRGTGDDYCHFKVTKHLDVGSVTLESVRNNGIYIGLQPNGNAMPLVHTGEKNIMFYPKVIKFGQEKPTGTYATPEQKKEMVTKRYVDVVQAQGPVAQSPSVSPPVSKRELHKTKTTEEYNANYFSNEWKVSTLTGNVGTTANVTLWVYGIKGATGPITLGKGNHELLLQQQQEDHFMVKMPKIGKIYKIRIELNGSDQAEWKLQRVILQKMKTGKTLHFEVNKLLSRMSEECDFMCELPVMENGAFIYPVVKYQVNVYTGSLEQAGTHVPVYICIHGERGDTGKIILFKSDSPNKFQRGQVDVFEIEAVSLGKLQKVLLGCEANHKSQYWHCEKVIIREQAKDSEYIFNCERWLPFMSQGVLHFETELQAEEMQITPKPKQMEEEYEGDWKVTVITGNFHEAATDATVFLHVYGKETDSGPITLGSGGDQLFNINSADTFQVNLRHLGKPYKIRIGHDNSGENPSWYLEGIELQNLTSKEEFYLPINKWLAEDKDDGDTWREIALSTNQNNLLPLLDYEISVYTGAISSAGKETNVYINIFGTSGDSGKRKLHKSQNQTFKFQKGQVDIFCIQAISLGQLKKIQISRDGAEQGNGWFLDKIRIHYTEDGRDHNVLFSCNRWLDDYRDEALTEIEVFVSEQDNIKDNKWNIQIQTSKDSSPIKGMKVHLVIYGSGGKTRDFTLLPRNHEAMCFLPGSKDDFVVELEDVGEIYKIRFVCNDLPISPGWHLKHIHMEESHSKKEIYVDCNAWLFADAEGEEVVKEFPIANDRKELLPVYEYVVAVHIGDHWGAETSANVYVTLYGDRGDSGARKLHRSLSPGERFARGKVASFLLEAVSLGQLRKVVLGHDGEGYGAGMYLKMVTVKESPNSVSEWVFPFWNWLDNHLGSCQTVCKLQTKGRRLSVNPNPIAQSGGLWIIDIAGAEYDRSENPANLDIWFYGDTGKEKVEANIVGNTIRVKEELKNVGYIFKVRISWSNIQLKKALHLTSLHMKHTVTNQEMWLVTDCWVMPNENNCVEISTMYPKKDPLPVVEYTIYVHTGDLKNAGITGTVYMCIEGENGDTGNRSLNISGSDTHSFIQGQVDVFKIKAVHLGKLQRIIVGVRNSKKDQWFLERIVVKELEFSLTSYVFIHSDWITCDDKEDFTESVITLNELHLEHPAVKSFSTESNGNWMMQVLASHTEDTDMDISVVIFGRTGKSPLLNVENLDYAPFLLNVGNIGEITKVSFLSMVLNLERRLQLHKVRLSDVDTKQEVGFYPEDLWLSDQEGSESVAEVPAILPNTPPLTEMLYSVRVKTGYLPASGTDADVFLTLFGENGDTCKRKLIHSSIPGTFEKGKVNVFNIKAVDLGMLTNVHIEHNTAGYGAGWYLDQITIQNSDNREMEYWFPCQQWLDTGIGDKQTKCELKLLGKVNKKIQRLQTSAEGAIDVIVVSGEARNDSNSSEVSLTICCEKGNYDPVLFPRGSLKRGETYQTTMDLSSDLGAIRKVRLQIQDDVKGTNWFCKEVKLLHKQSNQMVEFPFLQLFTNDGEVSVAERSALFTAGPVLSVKTYVVYITALQSKQLNTDTKLFITVRGDLGESGRRKFACKKNDFTNKAKTAAFQLECVDIGVIQELLIEKENQTNLQVEKAIVEDGKYITKKYVFIAQQWKKEKTKGMSMTLQVTDIKEGSSADAFIFGNQSITSDGEWKLYLTTSNYEYLQQTTEPMENDLELIFVFYGDKGKSNPITVERKTGSGVTDMPIYKIKLTNDLGELYKVRLGLEKWKGATGRLSLHHLKMQNTKTLDMFNYCINQTLPLSLNGDRWIEIPVEWPLKASLSVVTYYITVFVTDTSSQEDGFEMSVCLHGKNGDSGDRNLTWQKAKDENGNELFTSILHAVEIGEMFHTDISMSSKHDCQLHMEKIHIKESSKQEVYIFEVNQDFSIEANEMETRQVLLSRVIHDENRSVGKELVENLIKVYTGDVTAAGTDANVYIHLFGELESFGPVELRQPLEHQNPFERGKVDTFKVLTRKLGRITHVEVGHDGKGFGSGWFLDRIEIINVTTNEMTSFLGNRWLSEDENDGSTIIQLYS